ISGIVGIIREGSGNQTEAEAAEQQDGQQSGPKTGPLHSADDTPIIGNASQGIPRACRSMIASSSAIQFTVAPDLPIDLRAERPRPASAHIGSEWREDLNMR